MFLLSCFCPPFCVLVDIPLHSILCSCWHTSALHTMLSWHTSNFHIVFSVTYFCLPYCILLIYLFLPSTLCSLDIRLPSTLCSLDIFLPSTLCSRWHTSALLTVLLLTYFYSFAVMTFVATPFVINNKYLSIYFYPTHWNSCRYSLVLHTNVLIHIRLFSTVIFLSYTSVPHILLLIAYSTLLFSIIYN